MFLRRMSIPGDRTLVKHLSFRIYGKSDLNTCLLEHKSVLTFYSVRRSDCPFLFGCSALGICKMLRIESLFSLAIGYTDCSIVLFYYWSYHFVYVFQIVCHFSFIVAYLAILIFVLLLVFWCSTSEFYLYWWSSSALKTSTLKCVLLLFYLL